MRRGNVGVGPASRKEAPASRQAFSLAGRDGPEMIACHVALERRARGMPGAQCTRSLVCASYELSMHTSLHSGGTGNIRHSPRNGFTAYSVLFPGTNCCVDPVIRA